MQNKVADFDVKKTTSEFRDGVTDEYPIVGRKYTVTHSDETAIINVVIGLSYAEDKITKMRDEVLLNIKYDNDKLIISGIVLVDPPNGIGTKKLRNDIFLREMDKALMAVRYADKEFFEMYPYVDYRPIIIWFYSKDKEYNKCYYFGTMSDYAGSLLIR